MKKDDEVIVPTETFVATASTAVREGGRVVFADIEPYQQIIDSYYAKTEKALVKKGQLNPGALGRV